MSVRKLALSGAALAVGLAAGWLTGAGPAGLACVAVVVAVMNGYSKAYSP